jgi:hypothetical protein
MLARRPTASNVARRHVRCRLNDKADISAALAQPQVDIRQVTAKPWPDETFSL